MRHLPLTLSTPAENLACDEALLDDCEASGGPGLLRFWESPGPFIVLGYANRVHEEIDLDGCRQAGVPIHRRCTGGGTVLQGPGCLNYSLVLPIRDVPGEGTITGTNRFVMQRNADALSQVLGQTVEVSGHTDLALGDRKFSGNAQRRRRDWFLFHGTFLVGMDLVLMGRLLKPPPRQPDYRRQRSHGDFVINLPATREAITAALIVEWHAAERQNQVPTERIARLANERYARDEWNLKW